MVMNGFGKLYITRITPTPYQKWKSKLDTWIIKHNQHFFQKYEKRLSYWYECAKEGLFMLLVGLLMALISLGIDYLTSRLLKVRTLWYTKWSHSIASQYFAWTGFLSLTLFLSAMISHFIGPNSIGSGIPEIKTVLQGCSMDEIFTLPTMIAKILGLALASGSGGPLGREGPYIHIACIMAIIMCRWFYGVNHEFHSNNREFLVIACAVGVACCFSAPIGGVLFSIEVTSTYFSVKNYWRGFFTAITGALTFKLLDILFHGKEQTTTFLKTKTVYNFYLYPRELLLFIGIGIVCGLFAAFFIFAFKYWLRALRHNNPVSNFLRQNWWLHALMVAILVGSLTFPPGFGKFYNAKMTQMELLRYLFYSTPANVSFNTTHPPSQSVVEFQKFAPNIISLHEPFNRAPKQSYKELFTFTFVQFFSTLLMITAPIPNGLFVPVLTLGAAIGRIYANVLGPAFYQTLEHQYPDAATVSGIYAMIGAGALAGGVTRTISTPVILFELTGQMTHLLPTMISVVIANAVAHAFVPSVYNVIIKNRRLRYLADVSRHCKTTLEIKASDLLLGLKEVPFLWKGMSYADLNIALAHPRNFKEFAIVQKSGDAIIFLGTITRDAIEEIVNKALNNGDSWRTHRPNHKTSNNSDSVVDIFIGDYNDGKTDCINPGIRREIKGLVDFENIPQQEKIKLTNIQISPNVPLMKVHELFVILELEYLYVTLEGKLLGIITFTDLTERIAISQRLSN